MVVIRISPTTHGMGLTSKILLVVSEILIRMPLRGKVRRMLVVNTSMEVTVVDAVMTAYAGDVAVAENNIFHKMVLVIIS